VWSEFAPSLGVDLGLTFGESFMIQTHPPKIKMLWKCFGCGQSSTPYPQMISVKSQAQLDHERWEEANRERSS